MKTDSSQGVISILIAIPVFNEFKYVNDVLLAVKKYSKNILVVDDGSTDGTSELLKRYKGIRVLSHKVNEGYGKSLIDAFNFANKNNFEWVITLDCDYQHEPSYIPKFYIEIRKNDADIISGSRYLCKMNMSQIPPPRERVALNRRIVKILNQNLLMSITDAFCGFKAYKTSAIADLNLTEKGYGLPLQLWICAQQANLIIREIPVPLIYHDPERKFCGLLEDSQERLCYYLEIIKRELGYNIDQGVAKSFYSQRERNYLCKS